jgi:hypothetical protein
MCLTTGFHSNAVSLHFRCINSYRNKFWGIGAARGFSTPAPKRRW